MSLQADAGAIYKYAIECVDPYRETASAIKKTLPNESGITVFAIGKAAVPMARAAEDTLGDRIKIGLCVTKYGHSNGFSPTGFEIIEAAHPVSDENSIKAARRALEIADALGASDTVLVLLSGGASSLFEDSTVSPERQRRITEKLLKRGANIEETNAVRRRLSLVKGGRFAERCFPARVVTLALSDVLSNDRSAIGSGITVRDETDFGFVAAAAKKYLYDEGSDLFGLLERQERKPMNDGGYYFVGDITRLCSAAAAKARELGYTTEVSDTLLTGDAQKVAESVIKHALKGSDGKKRCLIYGGETTVTVKGNGLGGRNQEMALLAALLLDGKENVLFASVGSDGTDGPTDAAGGISDGSTAEKIRKAGFDPAKMLENNDSYHALKAADGLIITGPTGTNVNDLTFVLTQ